VCRQADKKRVQIKDKDKKEEKEMKRGFRQAD
jgi:hypothetical protein